MLTWFWLAEFAFSMAMYVVLDGFDLGVGVLGGMVGGSLRDEMVSSISPVWDGNGTWLVVAASILFGAFPVVYSVLLPALYAPLAAMLVGLIGRGVALEFRHAASGTRWIWNVVLCLGSLLAAFMQGVAAGAYAQGLPVVDMKYAGNGLEWLSPFPLWCGLGLVLGYMVLGAAWLVLKGEGKLQQFARSMVGRILPLTLLVAASILVVTLMTHAQVGERWHAHPSLYVLPVLALLAFLGSLFTAKAGATSAPFTLAATGFVLMLLTLAVSYLPYIVPFSLTLSEASAPVSSQEFLFWGAGLFVLPLIVAYTYVAYTVFRGKTRHEHAYH